MENSLPAIYRTADAIDNLLVKVTINQKSASLLTSPSSSSSSSSSSTVALSSSSSTGDVHSSHRSNDGIGSNKGILNEPLTVEIAWQQKIFGPRELLLYSAAIEAQRTQRPLPPGIDLSNPLTQEYLQIISKRIDSNESLFDLSPSHPTYQSRLMIYTYTDRDGYIPPNEIQRSYMDRKTVPPAYTNNTIRDSLKMTKDTLASLLTNTTTAKPSSLTTASSSSSSSTSVSRSTTPSRSSSSSMSTALINNVPPSTLTNNILDPLADPHGVTAHAYKEHPYSTMYIMAAVNIDMVSFRNRNTDTSLYEICLGCIRAYPGTSLIEMRPGFGEPVPYDRSSIMALSNTLLGGSSTSSATMTTTTVTTIDPLLSGMNSAQASGLSAVQALMNSDCKLGTGKYGGTLRLRPLLPFTAIPSSSSSSSSSSLSTTLRDSADLGKTVNPALPPLANNPTISNILAYAIETHRFTIPDGSMYEYSLVNADEDIYTLLNVKNPPFATENTLALTQGQGGGRTRSRSEAGFSKNDYFDKSETDVLAVIAEQEMKAIARAAHRVGSDFHTKVPRSLKPSSYLLTYYLEIVAAANFVPSSGNSSIYIAYELVVPKGSGWKLLPSSDVPSSSSSSGGNHHLHQRSYGFGHDDTYDDENNDTYNDWDHDPYLENNQENDGLIQESRYGSEGGNTLSSAPNSNNRNQLRHRHTSSSSSSSTNPSSVSKFSNAGKSAETYGIDPDKSKQRRWLKSTPVTGITQVAKLRSRPYTFGSSVASVPSGVRNASVTNNQHVTSTSEDPFFRVTGTTSTTEVSNNSNDTNLHHPFGFRTNDNQANPGIGRIKNSSGSVQTGTHQSYSSPSSTAVATNHTTVKGGPYGEGMGSVSLVSSVHDSMSSTVGSVTTNAPPGGLNEAYEIIYVPEDTYVPVANFGYPIEAHLLFNTEACTNPVGPSFPTLFFSVYSRDSWDRHYAEGYGYMDLQAQPGCYDTNITCWKPKGNPEQEERDYYLGGATRLEDVTYSRIPSSWPEGTDNGVDPEFTALYGEENRDDEINNDTEEGYGNREEPEFSSRIASTVWSAKRKAALSRYGFQTISTGTIGLRCSTLRTNHAQYNQYRYQQLYGPSTIIEGGDGNGLHNSIVAGTLNNGPNSGGGGGSAGHRRPLLDKTVSSSSSPFSSTAGLSSTNRMPLTVEQIIMDAKALRRKDREFREARNGGSSNGSGSTTTVTTK